MSENSKKINRTTINLLKGDLTDLDVDAIAFYANSDLQLGAGFGNAITMRGGQEIQKELSGIGRLGSCEAVVTGAGNLKAGYIVHANGPKFQEVELEAKLKKTMINALQQADRKKIKRIAFPPMGAGFYGVPLPVCARVMMEAFNEYLSGKSGVEEVVICVMNTREYKPFEVELNSLEQERILP